MTPRLHRSLACLLPAAVLLLTLGCEPTSPQPSSAPAKSGSGSTAAAGAIRSPYHSPQVQAELAVAGLQAVDFQKGQRLFELYCMNCHAKPRRGGGPNPADRLAPPAFAVADHYSRAIADTQERIEAIRSFTEKPDAEKALMPGAVERFGLMRPMPLSEVQLLQISTFLATAEFEEPAWYQQHYEEEHGPNPAP